MSRSLTARNVHDFYGPPQVAAHDFGTNLHCTGALHTMLTADVRASAPGSLYEIK